MSLEAKIIALAQAIGTDIKTLTTKQGDLTALATTAKTNLVAAINEIHAALGGAGATINDAAGNGDTTVTWSADKIYDTIEAAKVAVTNALTDGAASTLDTLNELATALGNDPNFAATIATGLANRVRFDAAQTLTLPQQQQACANIGVGDPDHNFVTDYTAAKV
ncbi:MAG: hypothetical protein RIR09_2558 [Pseudomonadota bacterium]|jgi:hypothetical protein